ncbi:hypothetical protein [Winogradskyella jejuensis]|uniref:DUF4369 domain-containing protein n=1 Tax=Winogradskyella jejuensis TaxID=1089305 RepID=A0A1M5LRW9_9FLAO|nr:hypothetical protein [Winogradskyella jejuensis]SHG67892.1 hypothetical protein SAMN05444148_0702 [Winogradskyella jejuensis]
MRKSILTSLCIAVFSLFTYGQGLTSIDVASEKLYMSSDVSKPVNALGSPYVNKNFLPVKVKGYDDKLFTGRFNAYNGEMEINLGTKIIALDKNKPYEVIYTQNNKIYRTYNYSTPSGIAKNGFLNVVSETEGYAFLKEELIKYYDKVPAATSYQQDKPAKFKEESPNYYLKKANVIRPFPTKKKDLLKSYPKDAKKIKSFLKEENISLKKEEDLVKLARYLASL